MCGAAPAQAGQTAGAGAIKPRQIAGDLTKKNDTKGGDPPREVKEAWKQTLLPEDVILKSIIPCILTRFKSSSDKLVPPAAAQNPVIKSADGSPPNENDGESDYDDEVDEDKWLCNGSQAFEGGCKSG